MSAASSNTPRPGVGRRRALLAAAALVVAIALFFSQAPADSWLGRRIGGARHPFEGQLVLRTPAAAGAVTVLPPKVTEEGVVLPPLVGVELAEDARVSDAAVEIYRDADGDLAAGEGEVLRSGPAPLLPRGDGTFAPDGWAVTAPPGEGDLRFHLRLEVAGSAFAWQGVVSAAGADDPRR